MSDDFEAGPNARALLEAIPPGDWNAFRLVRGVAEALRQLKQDQPGIYQELWDRKISLAVTGSVVALMAVRAGEPQALHHLQAARPTL